MPMEFSNRSDDRDILDLELSLRPPADNIAARHQLFLLPPPADNTAVPQQLFLLSPPADNNAVQHQLFLQPPPVDNINAVQHQLFFRPPPVDDTAAQQPEPLPSPPQPVVLPIPTLLPEASNQMPTPHPCTSSRYLSPSPSRIEQRNSRTLRPRRSSTSTSTSARNTVRYRSSSARSNPRRSRSRPENSPIEPPYPWSTDRRAVVHSLSYLQSNQILTITGDVKCDRCERQYEIAYDLLTKFNEIASFIVKNKDSLHDRAPLSWTNPILPTCKFCKQENCERPVIPGEEGDHMNINWLFLLLGQTLGCLKLHHLKYFCTYTNNHRTGAKNRLLYLTYLALCKQLEPNGPFDR